MDDVTKVRRNASGVWVAYYSDWSGFAIFNIEIQALRCAVENSMQVMKVPFGVDPREWERELIRRNSNEIKEPDDG